MWVTLLFLPLGSAGDSVKWNKSLWRSQCSLGSGIQRLVTGVGYQQSIWRKSVIGAIQWFVRIVYALNRLPCVGFALETIWPRLTTQVSTPLISGGIFCGVADCQSVAQVLSLCLVWDFIHHNSVVHYFELWKLILCDLEVIETLNKKFFKKDWIVFEKIKILSRFKKLIRNKFMI